ncbi:hypothetical protein O181_034381 [Austropuccinia psidii MF-1]|uniref:Chromo domain-containing protein n=1 Tax=Austropuccinia psidii MF-1 TaxID=1389203 RepID=A0A9Q3H7Z1_9BASI|nr:hypothetical protein [Austropuccinia psidii MF-1]
MFIRRGEDSIRDNPMNFQQLIKQDEFQPSGYSAVKVESFSNLIDSIQKALWQDSQYSSILQYLNIKSTRPIKKLSERWLGPFPILKKVSTHAYHLKLPSRWKSIHPVFHISLLELVKTSKIQNWHQEPPPPITIEEEEEWEVSQVLDSKLNRRKLWYLVEWKYISQDPERSTWEPAENLKNCLEPVNDFHSLYPNKPGTHSSRA